MPLTATLGPLPNATNHSDQQYSLSKGSTDKMSLIVCDPALSLRDTSSQFAKSTLAACPIRFAWIDSG